MSPENIWRGEAPAKVNLGLRILEREPSGYHRLETVFQALALADGVELAVGESEGIHLEVTGVPEGALGPHAQNLAVRAARAFGDRARGGKGPYPGVRIQLEKRIPHGAGLGGGSSDAAAVLLGLNELHGAPLGHEELLELGRGLGADVPFFLTGAARGLGRGRGDRVSPLPPLPPREVVVAVPPSGISTAWAYRTLAESREREARGPGEPSGSPEPGGWQGQTWEEVAREAFNDFEEVLFPLRPDLAELKEGLAEAGARPALLAGSGSAVFGVFRDPSLADRALRAAQGRMEDSGKPELKGGRVIRTLTRA